jgi:hypothetical protein
MPTKEQAAKDKIAELEKKREQLNARLNTERKKVQAAERKRSTRRKILVGAMFLDAAAKDNESREKLTRQLDRYLTADRDRELFGLEPRRPADQGSTPTA